MTTVYYEPSKYIKEKYMNYSISDDISFNFLKPYELPFMRLKVFQYVVKDGEIQDWTTYLKSDADLKEMKSDLRIEQTLGFGLAKDKNATVEEISIKGEVDKSEVHEFFVVYTQKDCDFFKPVVIPTYKKVEYVFRIKGDVVNDYILPVYVNYPYGMNNAPIETINRSLSSNCLLNEILSEFLSSNITGFLLNYSPNVKIDQDGKNLLIKVCTLKGKVETIYIPASGITSAYFELISLRVL